MELIKVFVNKETGKAIVSSDAYTKSVNLQVFFTQDKYTEHTKVYDDTVKKYTVSYEEHYYRSYETDVFATSESEAKNLILSNSPQDLADDPARCLVDQGYFLDDAIVVLECYLTKEDITE